MKPLRIIFDTSVFQSSKFDAMDIGLIRKLYRRRRIIPLYGADFLEEMFHAYIGAKTRADLVERWGPFIHETSSRLLAELPVLWRRELVQGRGRKANIWMARDLELLVRSKLRDLPLDGSWAGILASQDGRNNRKALLSRNRDTVKFLRAEIAEKSRGRSKVQTTPAQARANRDELILWQGCSYAKDLEKDTGIAGLSDRWSRDQDAYPYFRQLAENTVYEHVLPMAHQNDPIDKNAGIDLNIMTHLLHADLLITNETGFMKKAFDHIWRPRGKVLMSSAEFAKFVRLL